ncbi:hypothetical protein [Clavibacter californiensis]|uniref:hypothetical protein n=1 Tax=Clavibacter californiensis TaxID=1401995 RepID=UPI0011C24171|nr:hypothetical protein [Clavibacter californiensis]UKF81711.1 hypothetical protein FGD68_15225 [Clavibacter californiensis]
MADFSIDTSSPEEGDVFGLPRVAVGAVPEQEWKDWGVTSVGMYVEPTEGKYATPLWPQADTIRVELQVVAYGILTETPDALGTFTASPPTLQVTLPETVKTYELESDQVRATFIYDFYRDHELDIRKNPPGVLEHPERGAAPIIANSTTLTPVVYTLPTIEGEVGERKTEAVAVYWLSFHTSSTFMRWDGIGKAVHMISWNPNTGTKLLTQHTGKNPNVLALLTNPSHFALTAPVPNVSYAGLTASDQLDPGAMHVVEISTRNWMTDGITFARGWVLPAVFAIFLEFMISRRIASKRGRHVAPESAHH